MAEVLLKRSPEDGALFTLDGIGTLVAGGVFGGHGATLIDEDGRRYECRSSGRAHQNYVIEDRYGAVVGEYKRQFLRGGGTLRWGGDEYVLRKRGVWTAWYELRRGGFDIARIQATGFPTQPIEIEARSSGSAAAPLLFAAHLVRRFDRDSTSGNWWTGSSGCSGGGGCGGS